MGAGESPDSWCFFCFFFFSFLSVLISCSCFAARSSKCSVQNTVLRNVTTEALRAVDAWPCTYWLCLLQAESSQPIACVFSALPSISCCLIRHGLLSGYVCLGDAAFRHAATTPLTRRPHKHQFPNAKPSSSRHYRALELLFKNGVLRFSAAAAVAGRCLTRAVLFKCSLVSDLNNI